MPDRMKQGARVSLNVWLWLIVVFTGLLISLWLSGALYLWFAHLDYHKSSPLTVFQYGYYYGHDKKTQFWLGLAVVLGLIPIALPVFLKLRPKKPSLYGDARFATQKEIKQAGLLATKGIIVGKQSRLLGFSKNYLQFAGQQHVLMSAPTRRGKGVGVVIPNLLCWHDSVVVLDIKHENWDITAGFRQAHGQQCFLLNLAPRNYKSHCWNPLHYISDDPSFRINDIQKIGQMLFPNIDNESPVWQASSRSLWLGLILYLIETPPLPVTMGEALRLLTKGDDNLKAQIEKRMSCSLALSNQCHLALKEYLDTPDRTRGSIRKSFTSALELFYNPVIDAVTSSNDFDLREIRKKRMSIYVGVTPDDLQRLSPLINLFFQQLIDLNTRELPEQNPLLKHQVLLLMDEFAAIGKVNILSRGISYVAGYGLRLLTIVQSPSQLRETYGHDGAETLIENHALQIVFAPKNPKVAREISEGLGNTTIKNRSRGRQLSGKGSRSENVSDHNRALMLPQEIIHMGTEKQILLLENCKPIKCHKIRWYQDKAFILRGNTSDNQTWPTPNIPLVKTQIIAPAVIPKTTLPKADDGPREQQEVPPKLQQQINEISQVTSSTDTETEPNDDEMNDLVDDFFQNRSEGEC